MSPLLTFELNGTSAAFVKAVLGHALRFKYAYVKGTDTTPELRFTTYPTCGCAGPVNITAKELSLRMAGIDQEAC